MFFHVSAGLLLSCAHTWFQGEDWEGAAGLKNWEPAGVAALGAPLHSSVAGTHNRRWEFGGMELAAEEQEAGEGRKYWEVEVFLKSTGGVRAGPGSGT